MLAKLLTGAAALLAALLLLAFVALRDDPARPATGERRSTGSQDAEIHYFVAGEPRSGVVALVPSYARSASDFNELVSALNAAGFRTLAMQPRGIDGSSLPSLTTTLFTYASDLAAVVAAEGVEQPVVVIGHAYGNRVARAFATRHPERTRALVLLAAGGEHPTPPEMTDAIGKALLGFYPDRAREQAIDAAFFAEGNPVPEYWLRGWYPLAGFAQAGANGRSVYAEWGEGGVAPMLAVDAAGDAVADRAGEGLARRFPDRVELVRLGGAGHAILPERPERVARAVLDYLRSLP